jgi:hypothetical protein
MLEMLPVAIEKEIKSQFLQSENASQTGCENDFSSVKTIPFAETLTYFDCE